MSEETPDLDNCEDCGKENSPLREINDDIGFSEIYLCDECFKPYKTN